ncbi:restriction endonuclease subunit S [Bacillus tequilensis]|uniref:Restriction endonuclease subunit S n=1 Tax=Bacillus tequilensis TaxID=227866 RepID=A0A6H0WRH4_9BACI|nr:restriction endonuclease subunit S [Bacillus tequilensis]QIW81305.1 restriction endonuclease subunit S [Bacillus tequilensis]
MSDKIINSPQIRFAGFTDAWEQCKLGGISEKVTEKNKDNNYSETLTNSAELGIINQRDFFDKDISNKKNLDGYYVVRPDDFVYNPRISNFAPVGPIKRNNLGRTGIMSPLYYVFRTHDVDKTYLEKYFSSNSWHIFMKLNGDSGARSDRFAIKDSVFREMPIPIPSVEEQAKIGTFFKQLDNFITLHQRKLELLKDMKKNLLHKMFPKDGANTPEIRFAGFTDAWEPRRLGDYANFRRGSFPQPYGNREWYDGDGAMPFVQVVDVTDNLVLVDDTKQKISKLAQPKSVFVPKGKVLVTLQGSIGRVAITQYDSFVDRTLLIFEGYEKPTDQHFWAYIIQKKFEIERNKAPGGTIKTITKEALSSFEVLLPEYKEQRQIGTFFNQLDNLITLHQRELNTLEKLKKSLLQQMFI